MVLVVVEERWYEVNHRKGSDVVMGHGSSPPPKDPHPLPRQLNDKLRGSVTAVVLNLEYS